MKIVISAIVPAVATAYMRTKAYNAACEKNIDLASRFWRYVFYPGVTKSVDFDYSLVSFYEEEHGEGCVHVTPTTRNVIFSLDLRVVVEWVTDVQSTYEIEGCVKQFKKSISGRTLYRIKTNDPMYHDVNDRRLIPFKLSTIRKDCIKVKVLDEGSVAV